MLYRTSSRGIRLRWHRNFRLLAALAAGVHAANGLAHGVQPPQSSTARPSHRDADAVSPAP
ncbi:hypothetical protein [Mycolicibacterium sp. XJ870]